jgi:hypothetical protein
VLLALVQRPGRLLEKDTLLRIVWPDTFVEENNLADNISRIRKALRDGEQGRPFIETVPRRGYRFVAEVKPGASPTSGRASTTTTYVSPYDVATAHAGLGDRAGTLAWLEKAFEERSGWLALWLKVDPSFDALRGDERFRDLLRRVGHVP